MQEWIIAMLVVSALLILRDMAKTIFSDMKKSAATLVYDQHPQKEKMQRYARSFQKLADSFYGMPYRKDYLSGGELEELVEQLRERQCKTCPGFFCFINITILQWGDIYTDQCDAIEVLLDERY